MTRQDWSVRTLLGEMKGRGESTAIVALSDTGRAICSFAELADRAGTLSAGLAAAGARPGERAYLCAAAGIDWIAVYLGALAAGLVVVPLDHLAGADEIAHIAKVAPADWVFADGDRLDELRGIVPMARCFRVGGARGDAAADKVGATADWRELTGRPDAELPEIDPEAPALLLQTSGTTGAPKLFTLSMRHLAANIVPLVATGLAGPDDRLVMPLPLHHVYPQVVGVLSTLVAGTTIVLPAAVTGAALREAMQSEQATGVVGVPRLYEALLSGLDDAIRGRGRIAHALFRALLGVAVAARRRLGWRIGRPIFAGLRQRLSPDLRLLISGGARLDPQFVWRLAGLGFDVRSGYGLAETASVHTANVPDCAKLGTEGQPFQGGEIRIEQPDGEGIGEIVLRGSNVFGGYIDAEHNRDAFTKDGWYRTGDLGFRDADGFLHVTGRIKEAIVLGGGKKIDPEYLEKRYAASPLIAEFAVLESGDRLVALIRADPAAVAEAGYTHADGPIRAALGAVAGGLPSHERLSGVALVREPLPRTRLGKLRRFLLPEIYRKAQAGEAGRSAGPARIDPALVESPRTAAAWRLLQERYPARLRGADDYLALDLGIDSLEWLNLVLALEGRLGISLDGAELGDVPTVRALLERAVAAPESEESAVPAGTGELPPAAARWRVPVPRWQRRIAWILLGFNRMLVRGIFPLDVDGVAHLPPDGPFVIVCNHLSYLDAPVLAAALPTAILRQTHWGAAEEQLPAPDLLHWLWVALNVFPLAEASPTVGLALARDALDRGEVMTVFPEAWRSPDGRLQRFMPGIGHLVAGTTIPVVPTHLAGTFEALPRYRRWPRRAPLRVRFGEPRLPGALAAAGAGDTPPQRIAAALRDMIAALGDPAREDQPSSSG
jgi:long-chain acyl-CoA synthetase